MKKTFKYILLIIIIICLGALLLNWIDDEDDISEISTDEIIESNDSDITTDELTDSNDSDIYVSENDTAPSQAEATMDVEDSEDVEESENIAGDTNDGTPETTTGDDDSYPVGKGPTISFDTVDVYGNKVSSELLNGSKLIMLNLWEPWCGPCVGEMPDLNSLYENYKDQGLLIIGAYSTFEMDSDARQLVDELGITYPIIKCNDSIYSIEQDYVPATFLLDQNGNLITTEPFAGSNSYEGWEAVIIDYLSGNK